MTDELIKKLVLGLNEMEGALTTAILNHYCRSMAALTGGNESDIRNEILAEKQIILAEQKKKIDSVPL